MALRSMVKFFSGADLLLLPLCEGGRGDLAIRWRTLKLAAFLPPFLLNKNWTVLLWWKQDISILA